MSHATPVESVMMQVPRVGAFVRALLPVHLIGGATVVYGVWVGIDPRDNALRRVFDLWWDERVYADFCLEGYLCNAIAPWGLFASPVAARVLDVDQTPWCVSSTDPLMSRVLSGTWDLEITEDGRRLRERRG